MPKSIVFCIFLLLLVIAYSAYQSSLRLEKSLKMAELGYEEVVIYKNGSNYVVWQKSPNR